LPRLCPICRHVIDDDRLIACPGCHALLSTTVQAPTLSQEQIDQIVIAVTDSLSKSGPMLDKLVKPIGLRIVKSVHWWIAFPLFWIAIIVGSHFTIKGTLESLMISRIDQEFREPRIQATMQKVINDKASEMLTNEIQPAVDRFRADLLTVSDELSRIRNINKLLAYLPVLRAKAISEDDRAAFEEIIRIAQTETEMSPLKKAAMDEIRIVVPPIVLPIVLAEGMSKQVRETPTAILLSSLANSDIKARAVAARALGRRTEKGVPDSLLQVARTDKHLSVAYQALLSFESITGRLKGSRGVDPILIEMEKFDIDKLEQWWKDNSEEVNKRLIPAASQ
jgi:hypothetical protein